MKNLEKELVQLQKSITFDITIITPEQAKQFLAVSPGNRNLKPDTVKSLVSALTNDTFVVNGETIVFDENGLLMDGHHRLEAISRSNIPAICIIVKGIKRDTWTTMDSGSARSLGDVFKIEGISNYASISTLIVGVHTLSSKKLGANTLGTGNKLKRSGLSRAQALEMYYKNADLYQAIFRLAVNTNNRLKGYFKIKEISVISGYLIVTKGYTLTQLQEFWNLIVNGDGMFMSLRNTFLSDMQETRYKKMSGLSRQSYIATVWNAYIQNKYVRRIRYTMGETVEFI